MLRFRGVARRDGARHVGQQGVQIGNPDQRLSLGVPALTALCSSHIPTAATGVYVVELRLGGYKQLRGTWPEKECGIKCIYLLVPPWGLPNIRPDCPNPVPGSAHQSATKQRPPTDIDNSIIRLFPLSLATIPHHRYSLSPLRLYLGSRPSLSLPLSWVRASLKALLPA
jgi:hypothetical protein